MSPTPEVPSTDRGRAAEVILSEERLRVDTTVRPRTRLVVRKRVVTEDKTFTVRVRREEFELEEITLDPDDPAPDPAVALGESELEMVLHEEQVDFTLRVAPVERVRVQTRVVTGGTELNTELRHEEVQVDGAPTAEGRPERAAPTPD